MCEPGINIVITPLEFFFTYFYDEQWNDQTYGSMIPKQFILTLMVLAIKSFLILSR